MIRNLQVSLTGNPNGRPGLSPLSVWPGHLPLSWVVHMPPARLACPAQQLGRNHPGRGHSQSAPSLMRFVPFLNRFGTCRNLQLSPRPSLTFRRGNVSPDRSFEQETFAGQLLCARTLELSP